MLKMLAAALLVTVLPSLALAQARTTTDLSKNLSNSIDHACIPADSTRMQLYIENPKGSGGDMAYCVNVGGVNCTPSLTPTAGSTVLAANQAQNYPFGNAPKESLSCIAAGTQPMTARSFK